ncbi:MAG TPA: serine protease [Gemmataceae bacterium]|nr:serine protease [Gemmataceae bacterium]
MTTSVTNRLLAACVIACLVAVGLWLFKRPARTLPDPKGDTAPFDSPKAPPQDASQDSPKEPRKDEPATKVSSKTVYEYALKSVAWILTRQANGDGEGTGSLIDRENRLLLTDYHVVHGLLDFVALFPVYDKDGRPIRERDVYRAQARREDAIKGKVLAFDKTRDLALIQLDRVPDGVEALPLAKAEPQQGEHLHVVGTPGASGALWVYSFHIVRMVYKEKVEAWRQRLRTNRRSQNHRDEHADQLRGQRRLSVRQRPRRVGRHRPGRDRGRGRD